MKRVMILIVFLLNTTTATGTVYLNDGGTHNIDYRIYDTVWVDYEYPEAYTTVNILTKFPPDTFIQGELHAYGNSTINFIQGGLNTFLFARDNSLVNFSSGSIGRDLYAEDNSKVYVSGGAISYSLYAKGNSQVFISGGNIIRNLGVFGNTQVTWSGGRFGGDIIVGENGILKIDGSNFAVDGVPVGYGKCLFLSGRITGILGSGETLDYDFSTSNTAEIYFIPEPISFLLFGFGCFLVRNSNKRRPILT